MAKTNGKTYTTADFVEWGKAGGQKSRRKLDPDTARKMALARVKKMGQKLHKAK